MGSLGESVRSQVTSLLSDTNIRSVLTLNHITRTTGDRGGYDGPSEETTSSEDIYCVPSNNIKDNILLENMGDVNAGELRVLILYDQVIDTDDKATFQGDDYLIRRIKKIHFNEVDVAQILVLTKIQ